MIIKNDTIHMNLEEEEKHIVKMLNVACSKIGCDTLLLNNKNTINDRTFISLFNKNSNKLNVKLIYINCLVENLNNEKIIYNNILSNEQLNKLLNTNELAIINTDTELIKLFNNKKINYNISVFKDYSQSFINLLAEYYNINIIELNIPYSHDIEELDIKIANDFINNKENLYSSYTREQLKSFNNKVKSLTEPIKDLTLYNSITYNYITGVNEDLEKINS